MPLGSSAYLLILTLKTNVIFKNNIPMMKRLFIIVVNIRKG